MNDLNHVFFKIDEVISYLEDQDSPQEYIDKLELAKAIVKMKWKEQLEAG